MENTNYHSPVGKENIIPDSFSENYENKLLILNPAALREKYRYEEYQYFFAQAGFGCDPGKLGTKVFGKFLIDGEETSFHRYNFLGVADEEKLPEWAKMKLMQLTSNDPGTPSQANLLM